MTKNEELQRMVRDMHEQPELKEKLEAEINRILETGEAETDGEVIVKAAAALGYTITLEKIERFAADLEQLDDNELDAVSGGFFTDCTSFFVCDKDYCFAGGPTKSPRPIRTNPIRTNPITNNLKKKVPSKHPF